MINILIVEDHEITRVGLCKLIERIPGLTVAAEAATGQSALRWAQENKPDLVLLDIGLPDIDGVEVTKLLKRDLDSKVILITVHDEEADIMAGISAGADAYCLKDITDQELEQAIHCVMSGGIWLDRGISRQISKIIKQYDIPDHSQNANSFRLSDREMEVLALVVEGLSNQQMAQRLNLSPETIKTHMRKLMEKLSVTDRTQAAVKAVKEGLIKLSGQGKLKNRHHPEQFN